jgi:predicted  nucleic acid-binding Zn-ribbon protein
VTPVTEWRAKSAGSRADYLQRRDLRAMAELEIIAETLRRQRKDLEDLMDSTASRSGQTAELVSRIEALRRRSEETERRFEASVSQASKAK